MTTAQFKNIVSQPDDAMLPLHFDAALLQFRQLLARACEAEH